MNRSRDAKAPVAALAALLALPGLAPPRTATHDHGPDRWEKRQHRSATSQPGTPRPGRSHLGNRAEFLAGDQPARRRQRQRRRHHGTASPPERSQSFDTETGRLTIDLIDGDTISGLVTDRTRIRCEDREHRARAARAIATVTDATDVDSRAATATSSGDDNSGPATGDDVASERARRGQPRAGATSPATTTHDQRRRARRKTTTARQPATISRQRRRQRPLRRRSSSRARSSPGQSWSSRTAAPSSRRSRSSRRAG